MQVNEDANMRLRTCMGAELLQLQVQRQEQHNSAALMTCE